MHRIGRIFKENKEIREEKREIEKKYKLGTKFIKVKMVWKFKTLLE